MLTILIESACSDGNITVEDRQLLLKKAKEQGISETELDKMIKEALEKENANEDEDELASGFITEEDENIIEQPNNLSVKKETAKPATNFTSVTEFHQQGAMSLVQKGKLHGKWIIIKRIKPEFKDNTKYKELFHKEFENAYHLDHPNIVRLLDKGEDAQGAYYTMEYIDGRPLSDLSQPNGISNQRHIRKILVEMIDALSYVHKKQIFHRDLKPDNIFITFRGDNVKILDFGLAAADSFDDDLLKAGTPKYSAPEQMKKAKNVDQRADIYTLGLILLEMLTGDVKDVSASTIENPNYKYIIQKCLKTNPEDRFYDCQEIMDALNKDMKLDIKKDDSIKQIPDKNNKKKKGFPYIPIIIGVVLIVIFTVLGVVFKDKIFGHSSGDENTIVLEANTLFEKGEYADAKIKYEEAIKNDEKLNHLSSRIDTIDLVLKMKKEANKLFNEFNLEESKNKYEEIEEYNKNFNYSDTIKMIETVLEMKKEADKLFNIDKNIARALISYNEVSEYLGASTKFEDIETQITECETIIKNTLIENLEAAEDSKNKYGFIDQESRVIIDYQFDEVFDERWWKKIKIIPVKKGEKWAFIDNSLTLFTKFEYEGVITYGTSKGYQANNQKITILKDKNGKGYIK